MASDRPVSVVCGIKMHRKEPKEGDWYGDDNLLRCGKCNAHKESAFYCADGSVLVVGVMCKCEEKAGAEF